MAACCQAVVATCLGVRVQNLKVELLWAFLPLVGALLLAAVIISWAKQWRKRSTPEPGTANDQLAHFRTLYERGQLSPAEFERVRALLAERLRQEMEAGTVEEPLEITALAPSPQTGNPHVRQSSPKEPGGLPPEEPPPPSETDGAARG
jgi:hypothetical protein